MPSQTKKVSSLNVKNSSKAISGIFDYIKSIVLSNLFESEKILSNLFESEKILSNLFESEKKCHIDVKLQKFHDESGLTDVSTIESGLTDVSTIEFFLTDVSTIKFVLTYVSTIESALTDVSTIEFFLPDILNLYNSDVQGDNLTPSPIERIDALIDLSKKLLKDKVSFEEKVNLINSIKVLNLSDKEAFLDLLELVSHSQNDSLVKWHYDFSPYEIDHSNNTHSLGGIEGEWLLNKKFT